MKIKSFTEIISGILCAALTMQIGWGVTTEKINASKALSKWTGHIPGDVLRDMG